MRVPKSREANLIYILICLRLGTTKTTHILCRVSLAGFGEAFAGNKLSFGCENREKAQCECLCIMLLEVA